jgi:hypothetical protein
MSAASDRLKAHRRDAGYRSARAAAFAIGVPVSTYIQHENGRRAVTTDQFERYEIFFEGSKTLAALLRGHRTIPGPEELAGEVYDHLNRARHWTNASPADQEAYRSGLQAVFRAYGLLLPDGAPSPLLRHPGAR